MASLWVCLKQRLPRGGGGFMLQEGGRISQKHLEGFPHLHPLLSQHWWHRYSHGHCPQPHPARPAQKVKASIPDLALEFLPLLLLALLHSTPRGSVLSAFYLSGSGDSGKHNTQQSLCLGGLPFWWGDKQ